MLKTFRALALAACVAVASCHALPALADNTTTNYGWSYPTVGADATTWGTTLNNTVIAIDAQVHLIDLAAQAGGPAGAAVANLGFTPLSNAGDTATGILAISNTVASNKRLFGVGTSNGATPPVNTLRWFWGANTNVETGTGNTGSGWELCRDSDAGAAIDCPIQVARTTGMIVAADGLTVTGGIIGSFATQRVISLTGDALSTCPGLDMSSNIACPVSLASVNAAPGTYGNSVLIPQITVDGKGRVTSVTNQGIGIGGATTATPGLVALATNALAQAGNDTTHALTSSNMRISFNGNATGHWIFPGGLVMNWLRFSIGAGGGATELLGFDQPNPNATLSVTCTPDGSATQQIGVTGVSATNVTVNKGAGDTSPRTGYCLAIGF